VTVILRTLKGRHTPAPRMGRRAHLLWTSLTGSSRAKRGPPRACV
jgi:hypothetical protein